MRKRLADPLRFTRTRGAGGKSESRFHIWARRRRFGSLHGVGFKWQRRFRLVTFALILFQRGRKKIFSPTPRSVTRLYTRTSAAASVKRGENFRLNPGCDEKKKKNHISDQSEAATQGSHMWFLGSRSFRAAPLTSDLCVEGGWV